MYFFPPCMPNKRVSSVDLPVLLVSVGAFHICTGENVILPRSKVILFHHGRIMQYGQYHSLCIKYWYGY
jgi:hypothetical protein